MDDKPKKPGQQASKLELSQVLDGLSGVPFRSPDTHRAAIDEIFSGLAEFSEKAEQGKVRAQDHSHFLGHLHNAEKLICEMNPALRAKLAELVNGVRGQLEGTLFYDALGKTVIGEFLDMLNEST